MREKGKKNNNPRAIAKMREIILRPEKRSQKPQIFEANNGEGQFETSSQVEDEQQQTRTRDKQRSKRRRWEEGRDEEERQVSSRLL